MVLFFIRLYSTYRLGSCPPSPSSNTPIDPKYFLLQVIICSNFYWFCADFPPSLVTWEDVCSTNSYSIWSIPILRWRSALASSWLEYSVWELSIHPVFTWCFCVSWVIHTNTLCLVNQDHSLLLRVIVLKDAVDWIFMNPFILYYFAFTTMPEKY